MPFFLELPEAIIDQWLADTLACLKDAFHEIKSLLHFNFTKKSRGIMIGMIFLSKSHALMHFSLALPKKAEVMVLLGRCGSRTFPWLQAARCSRWSLGF